uniref:Si:dkeyp-30e7.2 n=1 Tax=Nothobranchius furzeri TaxID=105023 RepID=A0A1A8AHH8_NOTFU
MPKPRLDGCKCSISGCTDPHECLHRPPASEEVRIAWLNFIFHGNVPSSVRKVLFVCAKHFKDECFTNLRQYREGLAERLRLIEGSVPTEYGGDGHTSKVRSTPRTQKPSFISAGCQTKPQICAVGTQLSWRTLRPHTRSIGIQSAATVRSVAVGPSRRLLPVPFPSTPLRSFKEAKRPRLEFEEQDISTRSANPDSSYHSAQPVTASTDSSWLSPTAATSSYEDAKFIVFEKCLLSLFETCPACTRDCDVQSRRRGTLLTVEQLCPHCRFFRRWNSQPIIRSTPVGDLHLSAAVHFCGESFEKTRKVFDAMRLKTHTDDVFRRHVSSYLEPAIIHSWNAKQCTALQSLTEEDQVIIGGDMCADSPGHSAKYGCYSVMNMQRNQIIDIQLVQSNKVGGSNHMEKEGLRRSLELLEGSGVKVESIITERRPRVQKFLSEREMKHYYDVRQMAKGLSKKLHRLGKDSDCGQVKKWHKSIINHLYWCAVGCASGAEKVSRWKSILNHIQDIHIHSDPAFPKCLHRTRVSKDPNKWFKPGTAALKRLERVLTTKRFLRDVENLSPHYQTSSLESFHNELLRSAPKDAFLPFTGRLCRYVYSLTLGLL